MSKLWRRVLVLLILGGAIALTIAVYLFNKPNKGIAGMRPDIEIDAVKLLGDFRDSETSANERYLGKILLISGTVSMINMSEDGSVSCAMEHAFEGVTATFNAGYAAENEGMINSLKVGDKLRVKGRCDGMLSDVRISDCVFVE